MAWVSSRASPCPAQACAPWPKPELTGGVAADVEGVGPIPFAFVAVGGGVEDQDPRAGGDAVSRDLGVGTHATGERAQRRFVSHDLVDRVGDQTPDPP